MSSPFIIIDEIGKKITELKSDIVNKLNDTTNGISDIRNNAIGAENATGGTSSAGTVMAKLNKIISDLSGIATNAANANSNAWNAANRSFIKQIYVNEKTINSGSSNSYKSESVALPITFNIDKTIILVKSISYGGNYPPSRVNIYLSGNNILTTTWYEGYSGNGNAVIYYQIIEFY